MIERRKFIRLQAPIGVEYRLVKKGKHTSKGPSLLKNIGAGGVRITAKEDLQEGDLLELFIDIPHLKEPIRTAGQVVWFSHHVEQGRDTREAGVRFRDIEPRDLHRILEYVHTIGTD